MIISRKILHVGNIANFAYANSLILREQSIDSYVLSPDSSFIMNSPEWEDCRIVHKWKNNHSPKWDFRDIAGYKRPKWYLGDTLMDALISVKLLGVENSARFIFLKKFFFSIAIAIIALKRRCSNFLKAVRSIACKNWRSVYNVPINLIFQIFLLFFYILQDAAVLVLLLRPIRSRRNKFFSLYKKMTSKFKKKPKSPTEISEEDEVFLLFKIAWEEIFKHFDTVQFYGAYASWASICKLSTYTIVELGEGRMLYNETATVNPHLKLSYQKASHIFVTNYDSYTLMRLTDLGEKISLFPHPLRIDTLYSKNYSVINKKRIFCPARHQWDIKKNDVIIRGIKKLINNYEGAVEVILIKSGEDVSCSKKLIYDLDLDKYVKWYEPMCRTVLLEFMHESNVIVDQLFFDAAGGVSLYGLACAKPVINSCRPNTMKMLFNGLVSPFIYAGTEDEVFRALKKLFLDENYEKKIGIKGKEWIQQTHNPKHIVEEQLMVWTQLKKDQSAYCAKYSD